MATEAHRVEKMHSHRQQFSSKPGLIILRFVTKHERTSIFCNADLILIFSNLNPSPNIVKKFSNIWNPNKLQKINKIQHFNNKNYVIPFNLLNPNPILIQNLWRNLQSGFNPKSTNFVIVRYQSNPSPVRCSSLIREHLRDLWMWFEGQKALFSHLKNVDKLSKLFDYQW